MQTTNQYSAQDHEAETRFELLRQDRERRESQARRDAANANMSLRLLDPSALMKDSAVMNARDLNLWHWGTEERGYIGANLDQIAAVWAVDGIADGPILGRDYVVVAYADYDGDVSALVLIVTGNADPIITDLEDSEDMSLFEKKLIKQLAIR